MNNFVVGLLLCAFLAVSYGAPGYFRTFRARAYLPWTRYQQQKRATVAVNIPACLKAHNDLRARHGSPPLVWDATLAAHAQKWADHLAQIGHMEHAHGPGEGENLFWSERGGKDAGTCEDAVKAWYGEEPDYPYNHPPHTMKDFFAPKQFGHYTQVVWKGTKKVGVAIATKENNGMIDTYIVARYSPQGNLLGAFENNVAKAGK